MTLRESRGHSAGSYITALYYCYLTYFERVDISSYQAIVANR